MNIYINHKLLWMSLWQLDGIKQCFIVKYYYYDFSYTHLSILSYCFCQYNESLWSLLLFWFLLLFDCCFALYSFTACFLKKNNNASFSIIFVFYLFVFFLFIIQLTKVKKPSNTSLLYSICFLFIYYKKKIKKNWDLLQHLRIIALLLVLIASIVLICKSLWIKAHF